MELWDVYNSSREKTGRVHERGRPMNVGDYHVVVHIWIQNSRGEFLITKRTPNKEFGNCWECTGGSAVAGDTSLDAALREVREETGLTLDASNGRVIHTRTETSNNCRWGGVFHDVWYFLQDFDISEIVLQPGETCDAKWATAQEIRYLIETGHFVPVSDYIEKIFELRTG